MRGAGGQAIIGGEWPNPLPVTTYAEPARRPTGLDWSKHTAPEPVQDDDTPAVEPELPATRAQAYAADTAAHEEARQRVEQLEARPVVELPAKAVSQVQTEAPAPAPATADEHPLIRLLALTGNDKRPAVISARELVVAAVQHLRLVATQPEVVTQAKPATPGKPRGKYRSRVDTKAIVDTYASGLTIKAVAEQLGHSTGTIRTHLLGAGVVLRDDRHTNSGGRNRRTETPAEVEDVRRLYVDERLSQARVAAQLGIPQKRVGRIMAHYGIPAREGQSGGGDTLGEIRDRLAELGVKSGAVRTWAREQGIEVSDRGVIPLPILDRYEAAHG